MNQYGYLAAAIVSAVWLAGCGGRPVPALAELNNMTEAEMTEALDGYTGDELAAAWGEPVFSLFGMDGELFTLDEERALLVYYSGSDRRVESAKIHETGQGTAQKTEHEPEQSTDVSAQEKQGRVDAGTEKRQ